MLIPPHVDPPVEPAPGSPAVNEARLRIVADACRDDTPIVTKRLVTALYEDRYLSEAETAALFARLGIREA